MGEQSIHIYLQFWVQLFGRSEKKKAENTHNTSKVTNVLQILTKQQNSEMHCGNFKSVKKVAGDIKVMNPAVLPLLGSFSISQKFG